MDRDAVIVPTVLIAAIATAFGLGYLCQNTLPWWAGPAAFGIWPIVMLFVVMYYLVEVDFRQKAAVMRAKERDDAIASKDRVQAELNAKTSHLSQEIENLRSHVAAERAARARCEETAAALAHANEAQRERLLMLSAEKEALSWWVNHYREVETERMSWTRRPQSSAMPDEVFGASISESMR